MKHKIHPLLEQFAIPLEKLRPLPKNPRRGDVDAIAASYSKWGQVRPIVIADNEDGTYTVVAGNHQVQAAHQLEWTHIAALPSIDAANAVAYALTDNRLNELGSNDDKLTYELLSGIIETDREFFEDLGWDDFELAALESSALITGGYKMETDPHKGFVSPTTASDREETEERQWDGEGQEELVTRGAQDLSQHGKEQPRIQHTLVFDNTDQQRIWYDFLRWLKATYEGDTTGSQLSKFLADTLDAR